MCAVVHLVVILLALTTVPNLKAEENIYNLNFKSIRGKEVQLEAYQGKVLLISNTASKCGYTGQLKGLQKLSSQYSPKGLVVLGFPSDSFNQELATDEKVADFCEFNYGVKFTMSSIVAVDGKKIHPIFKYLTADGGKVRWNFEKFLVSREGKVLKRFPSSVEPNDKSLVMAIEKALQGS